MKTIHCVAFEGVGDGGSAVNGVDWRVRYEAGQDLWLSRVSDPDYDNCRLSYFEVRVPEFTTNEEITELVYEMAVCGDYVPIHRREPKEVAA